MLASVVDNFIQDRVRNEKKHFERDRAYVCQRTLSNARDKVEAQCANKDDKRANLRPVRSLQLLNSIWLGPTFDLVTNTSTDHDHMRSMNDILANWLTSKPIQTTKCGKRGVESVEDF